MSKAAVCARDGVSLADTLCHIRAVGDPLFAVIVGSENGLSSFRACPLGNRFDDISSTKARHCPGHSYHDPVSDVKGYVLNLVPLSDPSSPSTPPSESSPWQSPLSLEVQPSSGWGQNS